MALDLSNRLIIGVSSRALFNLEAENDIFEKEGISGYRAYQLEHEVNPFQWLKHMLENVMSINHKI